jgi:hypothetical protein
VIRLGEVLSVPTAFGGDEVEHLERRLLGREVTRCRTARRNRAFNDSIESVVYTPLRSSGGNSRNGTNPFQLCHDR